MMPHVRRRARPTSHLLLERIVLSLAITMGLFASNMPNARAQEIVEDPGAIANALKNYADQAERWIEQEQQYALEQMRWLQTVEQYKDVLQHYADQVAFWQQQLVKLQNLNFQLFTLQNHFQRVADDYGITDACPGAQTSLVGDITSALQSFLPDMGGDVVKQQQQLCQLIQMTKNKKYNDTVDYLQQVADASQKLTAVQDKLANNVGESPGNLQLVAADATQFGNFLAQAKEQWQSNMTQDDAQIQMLSERQSVLSRRAMAGQPSTLGTVVNAATLKAALQ